MALPRPRVLYLGLPLGALCLLADGLDVVCACISRPDQPGMRRLQRHLDQAILRVPDLSAPEVVARLAATAPDQIVSWFWTKRIPEPVLALAPFGFNVHPSLLPRHRGADPYFWAIANGDRVSGVSAHVLTAGYDEGPILAQSEREIPADADAWRLARILDRPSLALMRELAMRYARGEALAGTPQDETQATLAPEPSDDDCELRWSMDTAWVLRRIRAAAPWPGAFTEYRGETVVITRASRAERPALLEPGQAARNADGVVIATVDGAVRVLEARADHEERLLRGTDAVALFPGLPRM